jgi:hypothetical protein
VVGTDTSSDFALRLLVLRSFPTIWSENEARFSVFGYFGVQKPRSPAFRAFLQEGLDNPSLVSGRSPRQRRFCLERNETGARSTR